MNPYFRFMIDTPRENRRGDLQRAVKTLDKAPSDMRLLADFFTELDDETLIAAFAPCMVGSFIDDDDIQVGDIARVLIVVSDRIADHVEHLKRENRNSLQRYVRRQKKAKKKRQ